jgi:sideroflexin-5
MAPLQSYNSGFNYANRNATVPIETSELAISYALAVSVACGSAFLGGKFSARIAANPKVSAGTKTIVSRLVPWVSVAAAGSFNAVAMRSKEASEGIQVMDHQGTISEFGPSKRAGIIGLSQVVLTRVVLPIPIILLPPFVGDMVRAVGPVGKAIAASAGLGLAVDLAVITACLWVALPLAIALFPQTSTVPATALEPQFHDRVAADGSPITHYTFNKGL